MQVSLTILQLKLIAEFFANMAVLWFGSAFIASENPFVFFKSFFCGVLAFLLAVYLMKEVQEKNDKF